MTFMSFESAYHAAGCVNDDPLDNRPARNPYPNNWRMPDPNATGNMLAPDIHAKRFRQTRNWLDDLKMLEAGGERVSPADMARAARNTYALAEEMCTWPLIRTAEDAELMRGPRDGADETEAM